MPKPPAKPSGRARAKRDPVADKLTDLAAARRAGADDAREKVRRTLEREGSVLVAAAAELVVELELEGLEGQLAAAFHRFLAGPMEGDKGCRAKTSLVRALRRRESRDVDLFLLGVRHVQKEPAWPRAVDTAADLRGESALGLVGANYFDGVNVLAGLLADPEHVARAHAGRALGFSGRPEAVPLLRFKILIGDEYPEVLGECMTALLTIAREEGLDAVSAVLEGTGAVAEQAAVSLGQSRLAVALPVLEKWTDARVRSPEHRAGLLAIAMLRSEAAFTSLLARVETADEQLAGEAIAALATYAHDAALRRRTAEAVSRRKDGALHRTLDVIWPGP